MCGKKKRFSKERAGRNVLEGTLCTLAGQVQWGVKAAPPTRVLLLGMGSYVQESYVVAALSGRGNAS